jgi:hypothetical protein
LKYFVSTLIFPHVRGRKRENWIFFAVPYFLTNCSQPEVGVIAKYEERLSKNQGWALGEVEFGSSICYT